MQPVDNAIVGPLDLPVAAGSLNAAFADPIVDALADFLGWMLRHDLDAKLAQLTGTSATAVVQATNVFTFDPFGARAHSVKRPLPALYVWWDGESEPWAVSTVRKGRKRKLQALYIFEEQPARQQMDLRTGLFPAVDAVFSRAADMGGHPDYAYTGNEAGVLLKDSLAYNNWDWSYLGGTTGAVKRIGIDDPETEVRTKRQRVAAQDYPAFWARFATEELTQPNASGTLLGDSPLTIVNEGVTVLERELEYDADGGS